MPKKNQKKLKVEPISFHKAGPKEAKLIFNVLDQCYNHMYVLNKKESDMLQRLRDLAAVAAGKPTTEQLEEEDY